MKYSAIFYLTLSVLFFSPLNAQETARSKEELEQNISRLEAELKKVEEEKALELQPLDENRKILIDGRMRLEKIADDSSERQVDLTPLMNQYEFEAIHMEFYQLIVTEKTLDTPIEGSKGYKFFHSLRKENNLSEKDLILLTESNKMFIYQIGGDRKLVSYKISQLSDKNAKNSEKLIAKAELVSMSNLPDLIKILTGIDSRYFALRENFDSLQSELDELSEQINSKTTEIAEIESVIYKKENDWNQKINKIKNELDPFYKELTRLLEDVNEITINKQVWMAKNLNVDKFRNGDPIPEAKTDEEWHKAGDNGQPAWCYYNNDPANGGKYGKLYNWYAVNDSRGLAPVGYHIPSIYEWTIPTDYSELSVLPGGGRGGSGEFGAIGDYGFWWSSTEYDTDHAWYRGVNYSYGNVLRLDANKPAGFSVRCLRD